MTEDLQLSAEELDELDVRCLAMRLHGLNMLLPNTLVAEVTDTTTVKEAANTPDWLVGFITWRGRSVPLISFESMLGMDVMRGHEEARLVVLNTLNGNPRIPFIAQEIIGLPHLSVLKNEMVEYDDGVDKVEHVVLSNLRVENESMIVPNLDVIERMLENLGISA